MPGPRFDPDETFSLWPMEGEEVVRQLLDVEPDEDEQDTNDGNS